ncbi:MAG: alpha/beta fold hydrolase [Ardenticatenales bacterium]|nr:alpha/beta fold hydrolase [Ardenticatenales bacterium]
MPHRTWPKRFALFVTVVPITTLAFVYIASHNGEAMFEKEWGIQHLDEIGFERRAMPGPAGLSISYFESGDPAMGRVIYVHGTPGDANNWSAYVKDPVDGMQSITYDRPGFGQTAPSTAMPSLADQARALGALLAMPGPRAVLVGHSLGGPIVAQAALDFPDRVAGLVMAAGSLDPGLERWAWYNRAADFPPIRMLLPLSLTNSNAEIRPLKDELTALGTRLGRLTAPTILIHSRDDSLVPFANVAYMQRMFPSAMLKDVRTFDDKDHFVIWNAAEDVRAAVRRLVVR